MSGAIQTKHFVKHIAGGPMPPGAFAPGGMVWPSGSGTTDIAGPSFTDALPAPAGQENTGLADQWHAFHRGITALNASDGIGWWIYHENRVWANDAPPAWNVAHTIGDQAADRDSGDHTGLYVVHGRLTGKPYIVGLYRTTGNVVGAVQQDGDTGLWTSGQADDVAFGANAALSVFTFWGWAVAFKGKLWATCGAGAGIGDGQLVSYDPETGRGFVYSYNGCHQDWLHVQNGRLFLIRRSSSASLVINEVVDGLGVLTSNQEVVLGSTQNSAESGGHSTASLSDDSFVVFYYTSTGGTGWRADKVEVPSSVPGSALALSNLNIVIPDGSDLNIGDMSWPAGGAAHNRQVFLPSIDTTEWPRGAFGTAGGAFASIHVQAYAPAATKFNGSHRHLAWNGEGAPMSSGSPTWLTFNDGRYSWPGDRWGRGDRDYGGTPGPWLLAAEPYRDGTVTNGLLLTIKHAESAGRDAEDLQILYGYPMGQRVGPGITPCTISDGDGIDVGGTAIINAADKSLDQLVGDFTGPGGTPRLAVLQHGVAGGPGFSVGETVTGGTSGASGEVLAVLAGKNRISVRVNTVAGFANGETVTGGTSGTTAALQADQDLAPVYQVIWDLDADGLTPNGDFAELSLVSIPATQARPPGAIDDYFAGPVAQVALRSVDDPSLEDNPAASFGAVAEPIALTDAPPVASFGAVTEPLAIGDAPPTSSFGAVAEPLALADNIGNPSRPVTGRPYTRDGGTLAVLANGVEAGARPGLNLDDPAPVHPGQAFRGLPALPTGPSVLKDIDGVRELGRVTFNAEDFPADTTFSLLDMAAAGLASVGVLAVKVRAVLLDTVTTAPTLSLGANGTWDDQIASAMLTLANDGEVEDLAPLTPRPLLGAADELQVRLVNPATATDFQVEVVAYGFGE